MAFDTTTALDKEWILSNEIGTYSMLGLSGALHSRSHSLLACKTDDRSFFSMLSKLDEMITIDGISSALSTNCFSLDTVHPQGFQHMTKHTEDGTISSTYKVQGAQISRRIFLHPTENMVYVTYSIDADAKGSFEVLPLTMPRSTTDIYRQDEIEWEPTFNVEGTTGSLSFTHTPLSLVMHSEKGEITPSERWYYYFRYDRDIAMGLRGREDLYCPGKITFSIPRKGSYTFTVAFAAGEDIHATTELCTSSLSKASEYADGAVARRKEIVKQFNAGVDTKNSFMESCAVAADSLIYRDGDKVFVRSALDGKSRNNLRDQLIAFPGLFLATGRLDDARDYLLTLNEGIVDGVPVRDLVTGGITADNGFWFAQAVYEYMNISHDTTTLQKIMPTITAIGTAYLSGYGDRVGIDDTMMVTMDTNSDTDGPALTWMDGEVDGVATTPRTEKAVEVNALWYNYLRCGEVFDSLLGCKSEIFAGKSKYTFKQISRKVNSRFGREFWNRRNDYLYDYVEGEEKSEVSRGNQAIVLGMNFGVLEDVRDKKLCKVIEKDLLSPFGISTLSLNSAQYVETLPNDEDGRAIAMFQGTTWPWLLDFYVRGYLRANGDGTRSKNKMKKLFEEYVQNCESRIAGFAPKLYTKLRTSEGALHVGEDSEANALSLGSLLNMYYLLHRKK